MTVDLCLYPLDTIKTRMQAKEGFFKSGGFKGIYRGIGAVAIGSVPGGTFLPLCPLISLMACISWPVFCII